VIDIPVRIAQTRTLEARRESIKGLNRQTLSNSSLSDLNTARSLGVEAAR
jgi:hypothetical protein